MIRGMLRVERPTLSYATARPALRRAAPLDGRRFGGRSRVCRDGFEGLGGLGQHLSMRETKASSRAAYSSRRVEGEFVMDTLMTA